MATAIRLGMAVALVTTLSLVAYCVQRPDAPTPESGVPTPGSPAANGLLARQDGASGFAPVRFAPDAAPLALRYNNYVAVKRLDRGTWPGQTGTDSQGYARFDDPAYAVAAFLDLMRRYRDLYNARSALDIFQRYAPASDCPRAPGGEQRGCPENPIQPMIHVGRASAAVGVRHTEDLQLFGPGGEINHDRMRAVLDVVVSQEIGAPYCPQTPRGQKLPGCHVSDELYQRALTILAQEAARRDR
jgi:hypothetical protein